MGGHSLAAVVSVDVLAARLGYQRASNSSTGHPSTEDGGEAHLTTLEASRHVHGCAGGEAVPCCALAPAKAIHHEGLVVVG
jgi:hypothetical protein